MEDEINYMKKHLVFYENKVQWYERSCILSESEGMRHVLESRKNDVKLLKSILKILVKENKTK